MIRTYDVLPIVAQTEDGQRTYPSGLVVSWTRLPDGREHWTYDYSGCSY